jgi:class 3 adenylate cyclase
VSGVRIEANEPCPLPDDPLLGEAAMLLRDTDELGFVVDTRWRLIYASEQLRLTETGGGQVGASLIGEHMFGPEMVRHYAQVRFGGLVTPDSLRTNFLGYGPYVLADTPGGRAELRGLVDPSLRDLVDGLSPSDASMFSFRTSSVGLESVREMEIRGVRLRDGSGTLRGTLFIPKLPVPTGILSQMAFHRDADHLGRTFAMSSAERRAGAVLFADLENSSALARRLSTSSYFGLVRRLVRTTDRCIVDAGGVVGRHVGDGVVAFFPVECFTSESAAARACLTAARSIRASLPDAALRSDLHADDVVTRFGLHWGSTLYMGSITTSARTEVTALGDEANEAARIEACATGGRTLASKQLIERLERHDAAALDIDPDHLTYTQLADLSTATDKARRDAPAIAVCEL